MLSSFGGKIYFVLRCACSRVLLINNTATDEIIGQKFESRHWYDDLSYFGSDCPIWLQRIYFFQNLRRRMEDDGHQAMVKAQMTASLPFYIVLEYSSSIKTEGARVAQ